MLLTGAYDPDTNAVLANCHATDQHIGLAEFDSRFFTWRESAAVNERRGMSLIPDNAIQGQYLRLRSGPCHHGW